MQDLNKHHDTNDSMGILADSAHYTKSNWRRTNRGLNFNHKDAQCRAIGLGHYTKGEVVHDLERAIVDYWSRETRWANAHSDSTGRNAKKFIDDYNAIGGRN